MIEANDDKTPPDGIVLEYALGDDDKTPAPQVPDPCPVCKARTLDRKGDDLVPPGSPADAMTRFTTCTAPRSGKYFVCGAGPFLVVPSAGVKVYLGPERRGRPSVADIMRMASADPRLSERIEVALLEADGRSAVSVERAVRRAYELHQGGRL